MINEKNKLLTVSWLSGLFSADIFISTGKWGVQMPPLTAENSHFLWSGPQETALVMMYLMHCPLRDVAFDFEYVIFFIVLLYTCSYYSPVHFQCYGIVSRAQDFGSGNGLTQFQCQAKCLNQCSPIVNGRLGPSRRHFNVNWNRNTLYNMFY